MSILSLNSYVDLLEKCNWEHDQLRNCSTHPEHDFILFNIILAMNHLFEWFLKESEISNDAKLECIKVFNPYCKADNLHEFKKLYDQIAAHPNVNEYQKTIRMLCNRAKHFKKKPIEKQKKNFTSSFGNVRFSKTGTSWGGFDHYLYVVEINNKEIDLSELISIQLGHWNSFAKQTCNKSIKSNIK